MRKFAEQLSMQLQEEQGKHELTVHHEMHIGEAVGIQNFIILSVC